MRIIKRVMVAIGAPMCLLYVESSVSLRLLRVCTHTHAYARDPLRYLHVCGAHRSKGSFWGPAGDPRSSPRRPGI